MENGSKKGIHVKQKIEWKKQLYHVIFVMIGLFFSIILVVLLGYQRIEKHMEKALEVRIGILYDKHPDLETDLITVFYKNNQTSNQNKFLKKNLELKEKYGYMNKSIIREVSLPYVYGAAGILLCIFFFIILLLIKEIGKRYKGLYEGLSDISEYLDEYLKGNYDYQKMSFLAESGFINEMKDKTIRLGSVISYLTEKMNQEKEETKALVTDISHQLKTPLASLKMSYEIMTSSEFDEKERGEFLQYGKEEIEKLQNLLDSLIKLSRLETSMIQIELHEAKLKETLIRAVGTVYMKAEEKNISIEMEEFEDIKISYDVKWTGEVFVNILDNAVKYSPVNTTIKIRVIKLVTYIMIEIEDEGIGIDKKEYTKIFQRFYRGNREEVINQEGSGVGLYLARKIVEEQGGTIAVKKGKEGGSVFLLTLPKSYKTVSQNESVL